MTQTATAAEPALPPAPVDALAISLCIATYRRTERLARLLDDLTRQTLLPVEVVVIDNHAEGSARAVIEERRRLGAPFPIHYGIQPERNIALTRNHSVAAATRGDWLAFIDDDERAGPDWLRGLAAAALAHRADAVLAPVVPVVPAHAPRWIRAGRFYDFARMPTGETVPLNRLRFGNVIVRGAPLRAQPGPFDVSFGLSTGEDAELLARMVHAGARVIWCDEAIVTEPIEDGRLRFRWLLQRAFSGGQEFARKTLSGLYGPIGSAGRLALFGRAGLQWGIAVALALLTLVLGRHIAAGWAIKAAANAGKLSVLTGWRYHEYAKTAP